MTAAPIAVRPLSALAPQLSNRDRDRLTHGDVIVTGQRGQYWVYGLVSSARSTAWHVISDYAGFKRFLPTVVASQVLQADGDRYVVEQVDRRTIMFTPVESTVRTENIERDQTQIDFRLVKGDLKQMRGFWRIDGIAINDASTGKLTDQILVTQKVSVQPGVGVFDGLFFGIFEHSVQENMQAICQEIQRREWVAGSRG